ncbi:MAG: Ig-like domain repeat protein [Terracidiphilus sp.]|jgi:sugar lactone lactonase YvrE
MLPRIRLAAATLPVLCATILLNAGAQTPAAPPLIVQAPFISVGAGNIVSGASSSSKAAACTGYANASGSNYGDGCAANQVGVSTPFGIVADRWGNVYFSDEGHIYVRVIYAGATTVNGVANPATAMIVAANASLSIPSLVAGDVYALAGGLTAAGVGTCNGGAVALSTDGSGCPATDSYLKGPYSPAVDSAGNVFIPDESNSLAYVVLANATGLAAQLVVKENASSFTMCTTTSSVLSCTGAAPQVGYIYQIAGNGGGYVDGVIANKSGEIHNPYGIAVDSSENLYIADYTNNAARMVNGPNNTTSGGVGAGFIHTIAGGTCTSSGCTGLATTPSSGVAALGAEFLNPGAVVVDGSGNVYIADNGSGTGTVPATVRVVYSGGTNNPLANLINLETGVSSPVANDVYTIAGNKVAGSSGEGAGLLATNSGVNIDRIRGLGLDSHGNLYILDYGTHSEVAEVNADTGILIFLSADGEPSSTAKYTVGDYCSNNTATGSGPTALDEYGDGCPAPQSNSDNGEGNIGIDPSGNLYYADNGDSLVRKLTFNSSFPATTVGSTATTQNLAFLLETGSTGDTVSSVSPVIVSTQGTTTGSEFTNAGTGDSCSGSATLKGLSSSSNNTASTVCVVPVTFKPAAAGARSGAVQITGTISSVPTLLGTVYLNGIGNGASLAIDPGTSSKLGSVSGPEGVTTDSAGNVYIAYNNGTVYRTPKGGGASVEVGGGLTTPHQVAIDGAGNLYVADSGTNEIVEFPGASTGSAITGTAIVSGLTSPKGVAVDASGNLYIAETGSVLLQSIDNGTQTQLGSGFTTPAALAVDSNGNVYVADTGLNEIVELAIADGAVAQQTTETLLSGTTPVSVAVDAAGDVYYGDSTKGEVVEIPLGGTTAAIDSGFTAPVGVALDPSGNLYVADSASGAGISYFNRAAATLPAIPDGRTSDATITNIGNTSYSGGIASNSDPTASTDFTLFACTPVQCISPTSFTLAFGNNYELAVTTHTATASDLVTFTGGSTLQLSSGAAVAAGTTTTLNVNNPSVTYGTAITGSVTVTGSLNPSGTVTLLNGSTTLGSCALVTVTSNTSSCNFSLNNVNANVTSITASYGGDSNNSASLSNGTAVNIAQASTTTTLSLTSSASLIEGSAFTGTATVTPAAASGIVSVYLDGGTAAATTCTLSGGTCSWSLSGVGIGGHSLTAKYPGNTNYANSSTTSGTSITVTAPPQAPAVATGDSRTVTEPSFPVVCQQLNAALASVNDDLPTSVDATVTNPDGARIQAALASCSTNHPGQAVELSVGGAGLNAFLTGPLSMPSNVTLLVDPGVYVYFSRNAQDYDKVAGTHTCGTVGSASATSSCQPLIDIPGTSTNVGIMGFGKLDGRGGDVLINAIAPYQGQSWWGLSAIANSGGTQENPRFIQIDTGASNITLYKITLRNSPLFHISTTGAASNFTAWDIKIITPTSSRNTDGIDPGNATNFTITRSWVSDGDDNIAVGAAGTTAPAANISVTNNHFFAGHGESIGSYTSAGVSNILFDSNMSSGNGVAGAGSAVSSTGTFTGGVADSNSTGLRIKSGFDRGGVVTNVQYSNSCYQDHKAEIVFSPNYEATTGTETPNLNNILMQNLTFLTAGTAQFTGSSNGATVYQLQATLDNVTFPSTYPSSDFSPSPTNASLTLGPGDVSSNFVTDYGTFVGSNSNTVTNNITVATTFPPQCNFTYIAPELTGPSGRPQTILFGQNATAVVILTPAVGGAAYPTGTVTLTDALTSNTTTVTLTGTTDTISIPLGVLSVGTHTFSATYSGDSNYTLTGSQTVYSTTTPYVITVNAGSLSGTTTALSGVPSSSPFGTPFTATATVTGSSPTGTVQFVVSGGGATGSYVYATSTVNAGTASASISLPFNATAYSIAAVYSGDAVNAGSTSSAVPVTISQGLTVTSLSANTTTTALGHPVSITATVTSAAGTPTGTVNFTYSTTPSGTQISLGSAALSNGMASASVDLPIGIDYFTATYVANGSFAGSPSTPLMITVSLPPIIGLSGNPIPLPYTMTTIAGGSGLAIPSSGNMACTGATDKYGDGCQGTAISFTASDDMRAVVADPFGNVYLSDISAALVRRITPNGVISNFAGLVSGTACVPTASTGCKPTLVSIGKARGVGSDAAGDIFIANYTGNEVFEVKKSTGLLYLVAGTGVAGDTGDGNAATSAEINNPRGAWGDTIGNVYIADTAGNRIRVVDAFGNIHPFAGNGTAGSNGDGAAATSAEINNPQGVITDANLNVYIADSSGGRIRVVCVTCGTGSPLDALLAKLGISSPVNGNIYTVAGSGSTAADSYTVPVLSTGVPMSPQKLAFDPAGNLYISDGNGFIWFLDFHTGYLRAVAENAAICASHTDSYGDGCPATQASFGDGGNGIGVGADALGNIYISDTTNGLIRKVITGLQSPPTAIGTTSSLPVQLHFTAGAGFTNIASGSNGEWTVAAFSCSTNADTTTDCQFTSTFNPAVPGARSTPMLVTDTLSHTAYLALTGTGLGAGSTLDPATQISFGAGLQVAGLATDTGANVYVSDAISKKLFRFYTPAALTQGASATPYTLATLTAPGPVAVDQRGFIYVGDTSTGLITQVSATGSILTLAFKFITPAGMAVDALNNLYVSDSSAKAVYQIDPITGATNQLLTGALVAPAGLAIDPSGNLLITDPGAGAIYRFNQQTGVTSTVSSTVVKPSAIAVDAAGNLLIADTADILAVPASSNSASFTVASLAPTALAIDATGNLYTSTGSTVLQLARTQGYVQYAAGASPKTVDLLESGNQVYAATAFTQTDSTDYSLVPTASTDCVLNSSGAGTLAIGGLCALTASYTPTTFVKTTDAVTFNGNLTNSLVQLTLTGPVPAPTPTVTLGFSPTSPVWGQTVLLTVTVAGVGPVQPVGTVVFTVDSSTYPATLTGSTASVQVSGLSVGSHTVSVSVPASKGYNPVITPSTILTVGQATLTITASNSSTTYGTKPSVTPIYGTFAGTDTAASLTTAPTCVSSVTTSTAAGTHTGANTCSGAVDPNYIFNYVAGNAVVGQASLTITASNTNSTYGTVPSVTPIYGTFAGADTAASLTTAPTCVSSVTASTAAGTHTGANTCSGAVDPNYTFNYVAGNAVVGQASLTITASSTSTGYGSVPSVTPIYGTFAGSDTAASLTTAPICVSSVTASTAVGTYTGANTCSGAVDPNYTFSYVAGNAVVGKTTPTVTLTSSANPSLSQNPVTFTAKVTSPAGTPTQTVTFLDGTTTIGTGTLSGGVATLTISNLADGAHSITAAYGGDANFNAATSSALPQLVEDFGFTISAPAVTVTPGGTAVFTFTVAPVDGSAFIAAINLTASGLPPGASYTISPATLAAGGGSTPVTLTINIPQSQASATPFTRHSGQQLAANRRGSGAGYLASRLAPFTLALLLLPFAGRLRRTGKKLGRTMLVLVLLTSCAAITTWISGCGASTGYFTQQQQTYTVTVTGTSGALSRSATVTLTVE